MGCLKFSPLSAHYFGQFRIAVNTCLDRISEGVVTTNGGLRTDISTYTLIGTIRPNRYSNQTNVVFHCLNNRVHAAGEHLLGETECVTFDGMERNM